MMVHDFCSCRDEWPHVFIAIMKRFRGILSALVLSVSEAVNLLFYLATLKCFSTALKKKEEYQESRTANGVFVEPTILSYKNSIPSDLSSFFGIKIKKKCQMSSNLQ